MEKCPKCGSDLMEKCPKCPKCGSDLMEKCPKCENNTLYRYKDLGLFQCCDLNCCYYCADGIKKDEKKIDFKPELIPIPDSPEQSIDGEKTTVYRKGFNKAKVDKTLSLSMGSCHGIVRSIEDAVHDSIKGFTYSEEANFWFGMARVVKMALDDLATRKMRLARENKEL